MLETSPDVGDVGVLECWRLETRKLQLETPYNKPLGGYICISPILMSDFGLKIAPTSEMLQRLQPPTSGTR
jgi:hypothetical protein